MACASKGGCSRSTGWRGGRLAVLVVASSLVAATIPLLVAAPRVAAITCPDPTAPAPLHQSAGYLVPDTGDPANNCLPQPVDSNFLSSAAADLTHPCNGDDPSDKTDTARYTPPWAWISDVPRLARGVVPSPQTSVNTIDGSFVRDADAPFNHDSHDLDIFLDLDGTTRGLIATGNLAQPLDANGNPEQPEVGRLEVEWENGRFEGDGAADWTSSNRGPLGPPMFVWPAGGDRVATMGAWMVDCGHTYYANGSYNYRSEIHPPQWMAVTRRAQPTTTTDRPAVRVDVYGSGAANRSWETELCNSRGLIDDFLSTGHCGTLTEPPLQPIDIDLYPPGTTYDAWGNPTANPPVGGATPAMSFIDQGKGSLPASWVTTYADHFHVHVPLSVTGLGEWGGSFDVSWETGGAQPTPRRYVASFTHLNIDDNDDVLPCAGDWRLWSHVNGQWQKIFDHDNSVCAGPHSLSQDFTFSDLPGGAPVRIWTSGYEKDGLDACFGDPFPGDFTHPANLAPTCLDESDNPGMVQRTFPSADAAALAGRQVQHAAKMTDDEGFIEFATKGVAPVYSVEYVVQPQEVFDCGFVAYEAIGPGTTPGAHCGSGNAGTIGPRNAIRLWEPGARHFTASSLEYKTWCDPDSEPDDYVGTATAPFDLYPPIPTDKGVLACHLKFVALDSLGLPQGFADYLPSLDGAVRTVDFGFDPTAGTETDPPVFSVYRSGGLPLFGQFIDRAGDSDWLTGSSFCSILNPLLSPPQPFCTAPTSGAAYVTVLGNDAHTMRPGLVTLDGNTLTCSTGFVGQCGLASLDDQDRGWLWSVQVTTDGSHHLHVEASDTDPSGSHTGSIDYDFAVDLHNPSATATVAPPAPDGTEGWYRGAVTVALTGSDPAGGSGLDRIEYRLDGGTLLAQDGASGPPIAISGDGVHTLAYAAVDAAGRRSCAGGEPTCDPTVLTVKIDGTAPALSGAPDRAPDVRGWYNRDVTVHFTSSDATSGVLAGSVTADTVLTQGASQHVDGSATDHAGNVATTRVGPISVDETRPTLAVTGAGDGSFTYTAAELSAGIFTNATSLTVSYSAGDALSGLYQVRLDGVAPSTSATGSLTTPLAAGVSTHTLTAEDQAGNLTSISFQVVSSPPGTFSGGVSPQGGGFWKNAVSSGVYTSSQMAALLAEADLVSRVFGATVNRWPDATLSNYQSYLTVTPNSSMDFKVRRELLVAWLNLVSGREPASQPIDLSSVTGWPTIVTNTGGSSHTTALNLLRETERRLAASPTSTQLSTIKNLLEKLNAGQLNT